VADINLLSLQSDETNTELFGDFLSWYFEETRFFTTVFQNNLQALQIVKPYYFQVDDFLWQSTDGAFQDNDDFQNLFGWEGISELMVVPSFLNSNSLMS
jgi:hypothetical protein